MYRILEKRELNPTVTLMKIHAPAVAKKAEPGQFVILRTDAQGERIPLTVADYDRAAGSVTIIFQVVGATTEKLNHLGVGDSLHDFVGPLGRPTNTAGKRRVAVVGGGDTALQDALFLSGLCSQVTLIHRREAFRGARRLVEQVQARDNIVCQMDSTVEALLAREGRLTGLTIHGRITGETQRLDVEGLFIAVGQQPQNGPFAPLLAVDDGGYLLAGEDCAASLPGVFAAGDCRAKAVRQLTTAVGDGAVAGLAACRWVDGHPQ